jgi:hypothetical protein
MRYFFGIFVLCFTLTQASPQIREKLLADTLIHTAAAVRSIEPSNEDQVMEAIESIIPETVNLMLPEVEKPYADPLHTPIPIKSLRDPPTTSLTANSTPETKYLAKNMICDYHHSDGIGSKIRCYELDINQLTFIPEECNPGPHGGIVCEKQLFPV